MEKNCWIIIRCNCYQTCTLLSPRMRSGRASNFYSIKTAASLSNYTLQTHLDPINTCNTKKKKKKNSFGRTSSIGVSDQTTTHFVAGSGLFDGRGPLGALTVGRIGTRKTCFSRAENGEVRGHVCLCRSRYARQGEEHKKETLFCRMATFLNVL